MRDVVPIPTRLWHGNDLYPLPSNYLEIYKADKEAARQVRVNACRQWLVPRVDIIRVLERAIPAWSSLSEADQWSLVTQYKAEAFVASMRFFDAWYLHPDRDAGFDPMFYDEEPLPTPDFHWDLMRDWATHPMSLGVAPRGSGKSMCLRKPFILSMVTRPVYKILYCTSSEKNTAETADMVRTQCYMNQRLNDDFGPEMPTGSIRPKRSEATTGLEMFKLSNGSQLVVYSVNSKLRGGRPRWFALDDPEYDPQASTSMSQIRSYMSRLLFKIALPMVMRREARLTWLATFVSKRHYAWLATETEPVIEDGKVVYRSKVPEFDYWKRRVITACWEDGGKLKSCWPYMWPASDEEKKELHLDPSTRTLPEVRASVGPANFNSEYMAKPGTSDEGYFNLNDQKHGWWVLKSTVDDEFGKDPRKSKTVIKWMSGDQERSAPLHEFLLTLRLFITMDTSKTAKKDSDYKVATLMGVNDEQDLFVLDTWASQCDQVKLIHSAFEMASRWGCRYIFPEEIEDGIALVNTMKNEVQRAIKMGKKPESMPVIKGFNPGYTTKNTKISALLLRVEHGKLKLPFMWRMRRPWLDLFDQFDGFNPDVEDGGLKNDDLLDTVSMSEYVVGRKLPKKPEEEIEERDVMKLLEQGQTHDKMGNPLVSYLDLSKMGAGDLMRMAAAIRKPSTESVL